MPGQIGTARGRGACAKNAASSHRLAPPPSFAPFVIAIAIHQASIPPFHRPLTTCTRSKGSSRLNITDADDTRQAFTAAGPRLPLLVRLNLRSHRIILAGLRQFNPTALFSKKWLELQSQ
jgi:hypothetical protein